MTIQPPGSARPEPHRPSELESGRRAYRRRQQTRSVLIAAASTVVVGALVWAFVINTEGWAKVQAFFLDPAIALASLPKIWD
ncbi:amino acid ABC transporter permease, partial [Schumannella luteola]